MGVCDEAPVFSDCIPRLVGSLVHWAVKPPSTIKADPVMKLESSQDRNSAALAISSGWAQRFKG